MIDSHCHLYASEFKDDLSAIIDKAAQVGVHRFYMPAIDSSTTDAMFAVEERYPQAHSMMGLHPCSVNASYEQELLHVEGWLSKRKFAAIGEIGLDFYWDQTFITQQYIVFRKQISLALDFMLPIVIHSRNATRETISVIREYNNSGLKGIFHCFGGTIEEANQIIDAGFLLGIGGVVTYKNAGLAEVIKEVDVKHMVLETDAPYLAPAPFRGKRNESSYLLQIATKIADVKGIPLEEVVTNTTENALSLFSL